MSKIYLSSWHYGLMELGITISIFKGSQSWQNYTMPHNNSKLVHYIFMTSLEEAHDIYNKG